MGLVLTNKEYAAIPNTQPFIPPIYPQQLNILADTTAIQVLELKEVCNESKYIYLECENADKSLTRHAQDATEEKQIEALSDECTNLMHADTPNVL